MLVTLRRDSWANWRTLQSDDVRRASCTFISSLNIEKAGLSRLKSFVGDRSLSLFLSSLVCFHLGYLSTDICVLPLLGIWSFLEQQHHLPTAHLRLPALGHGTFCHLTLNRPIQCCRSNDNLKRICLLNATDNHKLLNLFFQIALVTIFLYSIVLYCIVYLP